MCRKEKEDASFDITEREAKIIVGWAAFIEQCTQILNIEGGLNQEEEVLIRKLVDKFPNLLTAWENHDLYFDRLGTGV